MDWWPGGGDRELFVGKVPSYRHHKLFWNFPIAHNGVEDCMRASSRDESKE